MRLPQLIQVAACLTAAASSTSLALTAPSATRSQAPNVQITALFSNNSASPVSLMPDSVGERILDIRDFDLSSNGEHTFVTLIGTSGDTLAVIDETPIVRTGAQATFSPFGEWVFLIREGAVNDLGEFALYVVTTDGFVRHHWWLRGDSVNGMTSAELAASSFPGSLSGPITDESGLSVYRLHLTNDGRIAGNIAVGTGGSVVGAAAVLGDVVLAEEGQPGPMGQLQPSPANWDRTLTVDGTVSGFAVTADGENSIVYGTLDFAPNNFDSGIVALDNVNIAQLKYPLPGTNGPSVSNVFSTDIATGPYWSLIGRMAQPSQDNFALVNGEIVEFVGDAVPGQSQETITWVTRHAVDDQGNYITGWLTTGGTDPARNFVLLWNSTHVILRKGLPFDLDGNGLIDDGCLLGNHIGKRLCLGSNGQALDLLIAPSTVHAGGSKLLVKMQIESLFAQTICDGEPNSTGAAALASAIGSPDVSDNDVLFRVRQLPQQSFGLVVASPSTGVLMNPGGSSGNLCINGPFIGRYQNTPLFSGSSGSVSLGLDLANVPTSGGPVTTQAGETRYWQYWYRDSLMGAPTSNFSSAIGLTFR